MKVDFSYDEGRAPKNYSELSKMPFLEISPKDTKNRFVPCLAVYGPNASGKTNILEAMETYLCIVRNSVIGNSLCFPSNLNKGCDPVVEHIRLHAGYFPNELNKKYNSTTFELEFFVGRDKYRHLIEYNNVEIIREMLFKGNCVIYKIDNTSDADKYNFGCIAKANREYGYAKIKSILNVECSERKGDNYLQKRVFFSVLAENYAGLSEDINDAFSQYKKMIVFQLYNDITEEALRLCNESYPGDNIFNKVCELIQKFDIDILSMEPSSKKRIVVPEVGMTDLDLEKYYTMKTYHKDIDGNRVVFDMRRNESNGTNVLFGLIYFLMTEVLDSGTTMIIDELDTSLHPLIVAEIVNIFKSRRYNKKNAQLIFTTQCADILDRDVLRISEVALVNKTLKKGSTIVRISDFKDDPNFKYIRTADFRKLYLDGVFSGIPFPYI
jgi:AAA15 family ATPase/GTPase